MNHYFDPLRLPPEHLKTRRDEGWEYEEQGEGHRVEVLRALQRAMHDVAVSRYLYMREHGTDPDDDAQFIREAWDPVWNGLRNSLTRQDLLRWLMDWALHSTQDRVLGTIERMENELEMLDDESGRWWLTQNPG